MEKELNKVSYDASQEETLFEIPKTLSQGIAQYLEKEIIERRLKENTRLIPDELATRLNVSNTPIRAALVYLEKDGLIISKPRVGYFVAEIKLKDIEEIYPIRAALNRIALKAIVENEYESDFIPTLKEILQEMEQRVQQNDIKGYFYLNVKLYNFIQERCPNRRVSKMLSQLGRQVLRFRFISMSSPGHIESSFAAHKRLITAIEDRNIEETLRITEGIIYAALNVLRGMLNEKNVATNKEF